MFRLKESSSGQLSKHVYGTSSKSGHFWDPKMFTAVRERGHKRGVEYPGILFGGGGVQQIQSRTEDRENGDLGAVAP